MSELDYAAYVLDARELPAYGPPTLARTLAGFRYLRPGPRPLFAIDDLVSRIYRYERELNVSILPYYVNNFVFWPRDRKVRGGVVRGSLVDLQPPTPEWVVSRAKTISAFDEAWYLDANPDVAAAGVRALDHYVSSGIVEGRSPLPTPGWIEDRLRSHRLFDEDWYLETYPDVAAAGDTGLTHWVHHGVREGRDPNRMFSTKDYLLRHPALSSSGENPLWHAFRTGISLPRF